MNKGNVAHDDSHVASYKEIKISEKAEKLGRKFAQAFRNRKAILGVFDEGCMGMFNAIVPDELLHPTGVFKERLSQSTLYAEMLRVSDADARGVLRWLQRRGMKFAWGRHDETDLTEKQTLQQCRMYIAAVRLA